MYANLEECSAQHIRHVYVFSHPHVKLKVKTPVQTKHMNNKIVYRTMGGKTCARVLLEEGGGH